jgi:hypothetical protein
MARRAQNESMDERIRQEARRVAARLHPDEFGQPVSIYYLLDKGILQNLIPGYENETIRGKNILKRKFYREYVKAAGRILSAWEKVVSVMEEENPKAKGGSISDDRKRALYFVAGQIADRAVKWAFPGATFDEALPDDAAKYLLRRAGIEDPAEVAFVVEAARRGFRKERAEYLRSRRKNPSHWSLSDALLLPGPGLLEEEVALAEALVNPMPRGYEHISERRRANEQIIAPYVGRLTVDDFGTKYVLSGVNDTGVLYWSKPRQKKRFVLGYRIEHLPELAAESNPAGWTLDPRHVLRHGTVMRHPHAAAAPTRHATSSAKIPAGKPVRYKGVLVFPVEGGFSTSLERESVFDTVKDARQFIDAAKRNPRRRRRIA